VLDQVSPSNLEPKRNPIWQVLQYNGPEAHVVHRLDHDLAEMHAFAMIIAPPVPRRGRLSWASAEIPPSLSNGTTNLVGHG